MAADHYAKLHAAHRWDVPAQFNIAQACCGRWAADRTRFALYWEDESGAASAHTFWDLQREANRLSNVLTRSGRRARRPRRADPSAAPRNRRRAHRDLPDGRSRRSAVVPLRTRRARIPARRFRREGRAGRCAVAAQPGTHPEPASRNLRMWSASPGRKATAYCPTTHWSPPPRLDSRRSQRGRASRRSSSTRAAPPVRPRAR